jgi:phosphoglycerate dehydrogenase-like enzyme
LTQKIVVLQPIAAEMVKMMTGLVPSGFELVPITSTDTDHLKSMIADADYGVWWDIAMPAEVLRAATRLKLMHKWGVGVDNIDLDTARSMGIQVARTTGSNARPVAEFTVGLMLALARRIPMAVQTTKEGKWLKNEIWRNSVMVSGKTVGIVGLGAIGKGVARRLAGFDCRLLYNTRRPLPAAEELALGVEYASMDRLLAESDIVSLHCPLTPETKGMIGRKELASMKRGALLVNLARGGVVVEADLIAALEEGLIAGAATDVFETEPPSPDNKLLHMNNVIVTPHCGATAYDNSANGIRHWLGNIERVARGEAIPQQDRVV